MEALFSHISVGRCLLVLPDMQTISITDSLVKIRNHVYQQTVYASSRMRSITSFLDIMNTTDFHNDSVASVSRFFLLLIS